MHIFQTCFPDFCIKNNAIISQPVSGAFPVFRPSDGVKITFKDNFPERKMERLNLCVFSAKDKTTLLLPFFPDLPTSLQPSPASEKVGTSLKGTGKESSTLPSFSLP